MISLSTIRSPAAGTSDAGAFTVGLKMIRSYQHGYFITGVTRGQWSPGEAERMILETAKEDTKACWQSLPQDPGQSGKSQKRHLANLLSGYRIHFSPESGSKEDRAIPWAAQAEAGNVKLVRGLWNDEYLDEITEFPWGEFMDQADATSRAFIDIIPRPSEEHIPQAPKVIHGQSELF